MTSPKKKKEIKAWGVYSRKATFGIVWARNGHWHMPLAVYADEKEARTYARDCNGGRRMYKVIPLKITYEV